jgi:hypothetical protein
VSSDPWWMRVGVLVSLALRSAQFPSLREVGMCLHIPGGCVLVF